MQGKGYLYLVLHSVICTVHSALCLVHCVLCPTYNALFVDQGKPGLYIRVVHWCILSFILYDGLQPAESNARCFCTIECVLLM